MFKKDDVRLVKCQYFNQNDRNSAIIDGINCRKVEICQQEQYREDEYTLHRGDQQEGCQEFFICSIAEEYRIHHCVDAELAGKIHQEDTRKDGQNHISRREDEGVGHKVGRVEVIEKAVNQTRLDHKHHLQSHLVARFQDCVLTFRCVEEILQLAGDETRDAGEGKDGEQEAGNEQPRDEVVVVQLLSRV